MAAENMESSEDQKQVAISMCSTPGDRSLAGGGRTTVAANLSSRSPAMSKKVMHKSPNGDQDYQQGDAPEVPLIKKVAAEFIGTFILIFTVLSTVVLDAQHGGGADSLLGAAASAGLAVIAVVLSVVHISGSHLNPAVSFAMAVFGHLPPAHVLPYAAAQTLASLAAAFLAKGLYRPPRPAVMATVPSAGAGAGEAFVLELMLTFVLVFVVTAVATDPSSSKEVIALAISAAITMNALVAGPSTGPSMNPARTFGAAVAAGEYRHIWIYLIAAPLGAIAGAGTYTLIKP